MPFLLRATPRLDLADWSLRSEVNRDGDRAFGRHTRPDPERYEYRMRLSRVGGETKVWVENDQGTANGAVR